MFNSMILRSLQFNTTNLKSFFSKIKNLKMIFLLNFVNGNHWSIVSVKIVDRSWSHHCSLNYEISTATKAQIGKLFYTMFSAEFLFIPSRNLKFQNQEDFCSCGYFACANALYLSTGLRYKMQELKPILFSFFNNQASYSKVLEHFHVFNETKHFWRILCQIFRC